MTGSERTVLPELSELPEGSLSPELSELLEELSLPALPEELSDLLAELLVDDTADVGVTAASPYSCGITNTSKRAYPVKSVSRIATIAP